jgi:hypothetical protein
VELVRAAAGSHFVRADFSTRQAHGASHTTFDFDTTQHTDEAFGSGRLPPDRVPSRHAVEDATRGAVAAAASAGRLYRASTVLDRFDADCGDEGPLTLLRFDPKPALALAYELVGDHRLRTLDAIHLAVALTDGVDLAAGEKVTVITRDEDQATAARAAGLATA